VRARDKGWGMSMEKMAKAAEIKGQRVAVLKENRKDPEEE